MIRVGIFFGGPSREREISFAGGKTAFEHLDQRLFLPVPVFVDGFGRFILLKQEHLYTPDIRAFYPAVNSTAPFRLYIESFPELKKQPVPSQIGQLIEPAAFGEHFDFAFLAMHGPDCEDGGIQGLLEWYRIPYSGPGLLGSSVGIDKILQNQMLSTVVGQAKETTLITFKEWENESARPAIFERVKGKTGLPVVLKAPHQGSSIGVAIVKEDSLASFSKGVNQCFFTSSVSATQWNSLDSEEKQKWAYSQADPESGIGYPLYLENREINHPDDLVDQLDLLLKNRHELPLVSANFEPVVLCEEFTSGQEFSCGCIQLENGDHVALPPTEVMKVEEVFDFNSKYKPGGTRKRIPVRTSAENNLKIQAHVVEAAQNLGMEVCVRIDGFLTPEGHVILHDPNTVPGMSPASLIFKQMAEIGLNITQSLTYLIRQSLKARIKTAKDTFKISRLLQKLDEEMNRVSVSRKPVRSIVIDATDPDYARARKWYARLSAEGLYDAEVFLKTGDDKVVRLPVPLLFRDFVEDVLVHLATDTDPLIKITREKCREITARYAGEIDFEVFPIGLQDIPAETLDTEFE